MVLSWTFELWNAQEYEKCHSHLTFLRSALQVRDERELGVGGVIIGALCECGADLACPRHGYDFDRQGGLSVRGWEIMGD